MPVAAYIRDVLEDAALELNAVQLGSNLTDIEADRMLRRFRRLVESYGLDRSNIFAVRNDTFQVYGGQAEYTMGYDPTADPIAITGAVSSGSSTYLTLASPHGITSGRTSAVVISGPNASWQSVNGSFIASVVSDTIISIPVDSTTFGAFTGDNASLIVGGTWSSVRPASWEAFKKFDLLYSSGVYRTIEKINYEEFSDIRFTNISSPPRKVYPDDASPVTTVMLYPIPDQNYQIRVFTEQQLDEITGVNQQIAFAQGYERFWVTALAIECADMFGLPITPTLQAKAQNAQENVKSKNRRSGRILGDPAITGPHANRWDYRGGSNY